MSEKNKKLAMIGWDFGAEFIPFIKTSCRTVWRCVSEDEKI